jgi:hypothetical protein
LRPPRAPWHTADISTPRNKQNLKIPDPGRTRRPPGRNNRGRATDVEIARRKQWVEEQLVMLRPIEDVRIEGAERFGLSPNHVYNYITQIRTRWQTEEAEKRPDERERIKRFIWCMMAKAAGKDEHKAAHDWAKLYCQVTGILQQAPTVVVGVPGGADGAALTSAEHRQRLEILLTEAIRDRDALEVAEKPAEPLRVLEGNVLAAAR